MAYAWRMTEDLGFRALGPADLPLLGRWLARAHVAQWWRAPWDEEGVAAEYEPKIDGREPTHVL